ncbi:MAG TPA: DsbA family protein [Candidatus Colwellbacteria bacterium]|nr:DsbA family protein [Candidatus Colwellbacteria bacterium]HQA96038.1 DsbA family protein [Candidatus Colwellbacteria bacterium]
MNEKTKIFLVPGAIVVAGIIIAMAVLYSGGVIDTTSQTAQVGEGFAALKSLKAVNSDDHILGNASAKVKIVTFSDMDCPYCQRFNSTIKEILDIYGDKIAVVYRHFPLTMLHPDAEKKSEATECAAKLGGNGGFWSYFDKYEEEAAAGKTFSEELLLDVAASIGLDREDFSTCLRSDEPGKLVKEDADNAAEIGITGTPFSIILSNNKPVDTIEGAYPIEAVREKLDQYIK